MKRLLAFSAVAVVSFALGASVVLFLKRTPPPEVPLNWIPVTANSSSILFDLGAMKIDIPAPLVDGPLSGQVKFVPRDNGLRIGYVIKVPIKPNPVSALPAKYRKTSKYGDFTVNPPDQVEYDGTFTFDLQDGDGFSILKIKSPKEHVASASDGPVKGMTEETVSLDIAKKAKKIVVAYDAEKCNVCD